MTRSRLDLSAGVFVLLGLLALAWMSVQLGRVQFFGAGGYAVTADFPRVGSLKPGATVEIAGVRVGQVDRITLVDYQARVAMTVHDGVKLQDDAIVSIKTRGLLGEQYVDISPGGSDRIVPPDGRLTEVEPPIDIQELISKYVFGSVSSGGGGAQGLDGPKPPPGK
ncbi:MAG: outer membrane lipid asymmetry maintenance protein MlaD [Candidatus Rokubacteria bacterium]|nr:outer membrane lipid asymmetry maintenance protein MlaD [Candidatus Rokubacteria bacterium]